MASGFPPNIANIAVGMLRGCSVEMLLWCYFVSVGVIKKTPNR